MSKTLRRNSKELTAALTAGALFTAVAFSLRSNFEGVETTPEWVGKSLAESRGAYAVKDGSGKITIQIHSNLWFELTPIPA